MSEKTAHRYIIANFSMKLIISESFIFLYLYYVQTVAFYRALASNYRADMDTKGPEVLSSNSAADTSIPLSTETGEQGSNQETSIYDKATYVHLVVLFLCMLFIQLKCSADPFIVSSADHSAHSAPTSRKTLARL